MEVRGQLQVELKVEEGVNVELEATRCGGVEKWSYWWGVEVQVQEVQIKVEVEVHVPLAHPSPTAMWGWKC